MTYYLVARQHDGRLSLVEEFGFESREEAVLALSGIAGAPGFEFDDAELMVVDLSSATPVVLVTRQSAPPLEALAEEEIAEAINDEALAEDADIQELISVVSEELVTEDMAAEDLEAEIAAEEKADLLDRERLAEEALGAILIAEALSEPAPVADVPEAVQPDVGALEQPAWEPAETPYAAEPAHAVEPFVAAPEPAPEPEAVPLQPEPEPALEPEAPSAVWPWEQDISALSEPQPIDHDQEVADIMADLDEGAVRTGGADQSMDGAPTVAAPMAPNVLEEPASEAAVEVDTWPSASESAVTTPAAGTIGDFVLDIGEPAAVPSPEAEYVPQVQTPVAAEAENFELPGESAETPIAEVPVAPEPPAALEPQAVPEAAQAAPTPAAVAPREDRVGEAPTARETAVASFSCEECIYVATCPNKGQLDPTTCGSFQWRSL